MTNQTDQHLEDIQAIRRLMESSSRFLSLSGMSGIIAGVLGIAGALGAQLIITRISAPVDWYARPFAEGPDGIREFLPLFVLMAVVLILAFSGAAFLSTRKARKSGIKAWTPVTRRMLVSLLIPLGTGIVHSSDSRNCSCRCYYSVHPDLLRTCRYQRRKIHIRRDTLAGSA